MIRLLSVRLAGPALRAWFRLSRGLTLGVRVAAFDAIGRVVLVRHTYTPGWHMPGGGVEPGETALEAARRELAEETGIALPGLLRLHGIHLNEVAFARDHVVVYVAEGCAMPAVFPPGDAEIAERALFHPDALPPDVTPGTRRRLHEIAGRSDPSPVW